MAKLRKFWKSWPIRVFLLLLLILGVYIIVLFGLVLPYMESSILERDKQNTRQLTDVAWSLVDEYHQRELSGELSRADAQARAIARMRSMRYGPESKDYFWINDFTPTLIMHPYRPDLEGQDLSTYEDPTGQRIFQTFIQTVQNTSGDYVEYEWQFNEDAAQIIPKISFVRKYEPWGWIIGTGLYLDKTYAEIAAIDQKAVNISLIGLIAVLALTFITMQRSIQSEKSRQAASTALEKQNKFLENVVESLAHPFIVVNAHNFEVALSNSAAEEISSDSQPCYCLTHHHEVTCIGKEKMCPFEEVLETRQPVTVEHKHTKEDGGAQYLEVHGYPVFDESGSISQIIEYSIDITQRKLTEIALKEQEEHFRLLYENAPIPYQSLDIDGNYLEVNQTFLNALGYTREEIIGRSFGDLLAEQYRDKFKPAFQKFKQDGEVCDIQYEMVRKNGEHFFARYNGKIAHDQQGDFLQTHCVFEDITERVKNENALRESEARYKSLFEESASPMLLVDPEDGQVLGANQAACQFYKYTKQELEQKTVFEININPHDQIENLLKQGMVKEKNHFFTRHRRSDNSIVPVEVYTGIIYLSSKKLLYSIIHDISEQVRSQEENLRLASVVEQTHELILITDLDGNITYVNPNIESFTGYSREEVLGKNPRILKSGLQTRAFYQDLWNTITAGNFWAGQFINRRKDGSLYHEADIIFPIKDADGVIMNYAAVKRDISDEIRAEETLQKQLNRLSTLRGIDTAITASLDLKLILDIILEQTAKELKVDAADILLFNNAFQQLEMASSYGFRNPIEQLRPVIRMGQSLAGNIAVNREPIYLKNLNTAYEDRSSMLAEIVQMEKFNAYCGVPLISKGELKGVLEVFHRSPLEMEEEWISFLETLAGQSAIAIDNSTLFENLQRANAELTLAYDTTLEGWAKALELRDQETKGHSDNVTEVTLRMAQVVGVPSDHLVHIRRGALLHDIGKMGIPDSILLKPGPLTDEEWKVMRQHPIYAYELLAPINFLRPALDIPYAHHERWDGSGYPRGLKGQEIPLAARIFAIVDVWEALSSNRPYRKAWTPEKVKAYLKEQAGIQFDPELVDVFLGLLEQGVFK